MKYDWNFIAIKQSIAGLFGGKLVGKYWREAKHLVEKEFPGYSLVWKNIKEITSDRKYIGTQFSKYVINGKIFGDYYKEHPDMIFPCVYHKETGKYTDLGRERDWPKDKSKRWYWESIPKSELLSDVEKNIKYVGNRC